MHQIPSIATLQSNSKMHTRLEVKEKEEDVKGIADRKAEEKNDARRQINRNNENQNVIFYYKKNTWHYIVSYDKSKSNSRPENFFMDLT